MYDSGKDADLSCFLSVRVDPQLWYMAGDLGHARYYSRFVALQIKADLLGTPLDRYTRTP
jgi:hypothetical protein